MPNWTRVAIPTEVYERIERLIKERPDLGYISPSSFLLDAVRRRLEEVERETRELRAQKEAVAPSKKEK